MTLTLKMESIRLPLPAKRRRLSSFSSLENQKNLLEVQIREQQTNDEENVREIKKFYEAEMCEARRLLNAQAEESARYDLCLARLPLKSFFRSY